MALAKSRENFLSVFGPNLSFAKRKRRTLHIRPTMYQDATERVCGGGKQPVSSLLLIAARHPTTGFHEMVCTVHAFCT